MNIRVIPIEQINATAYNSRIDLQPGDRVYTLSRRMMILIY